MIKLESMEMIKLRNVFIAKEENILKKLWNIDLTKDNNLDN